MSSYVVVVVGPDRAATELLAICPSSVSTPSEAAFYASMGDALAAALIARREVTVVTRATDPTLIREVRFDAP